MTKQVTKTAVPRLRFPEFCNAAEWEWKTLSHVCDMRAGKFIAASEISERPDERSYPCYGGNGLRGYTAGFTHSGRFPLIGRQGALCGNIQFVEGDFYATEHALVASPKAETDVGWLRYTLDGLNLNRFATGQAQPGLSVDLLNGVSCAVPGSESEQQKIADCLASLDEVIAAQGRKVEALKAHKRGLMQQLFPREGETRPRLRFPEFRNAPGWTLGKASDIVDVLQGYGFPERLQGSREGEFPFYKVSDISACVDSGGILLDHANNHIDADVLGELRAKLVPVGSTVFAKIGEAIRSNKRAITSRPCLVDNNAAGVKAIIGLAHDRFVYYLWCQIPLIEYAGGVVPAVNKSAIEQIQVCYPKPDEQQRIADCLSSLDTRITAETQQLAALKTHKQGLMQQLFPAPEAAGA